MTLPVPAWRDSLLVSLALGLALAGPVASLAQTPHPAAPLVLDRVVAVVNNHAILASDIDDEIRLSLLDPGRGGLGVLSRATALQQLIGRDLIQQQIREEDLQASDPSPAEVDARLIELRKDLPACVHQNCVSDAGWSAFLAAHELTPERALTYMRYRVEILRFIEERFRQGIQISTQEIAAYYHDTLLPQYAKGEAIPPLDKVSPRIEEILLQQRVNVLFDGWLENLRKQGEIEVLDPTLESPESRNNPLTDAQPSLEGASGDPATSQPDGKGGESQ